MSFSISRGRAAPVAGAAVVAVIAVVGISHAAGSHAGPTGDAQRRAHPSHHERAGTTSGGKVMLGL